MNDNIRNSFFLYKGCWLRITPPHLSSKLSKNEIKMLLSQGGDVKRDPSDFDVKEPTSLLGKLLHKLQSKGIMIRNVYDFDSKDETEFWYIIKDQLDEENYPKKTKKYIAKANSKLKIGQISKAQMLTEAYDVYLSAFTKYVVKSNPLDKLDFIQMISNHDNRYEYWGCTDLETGKLVAFSICFVHDGICECDTSKANPDYLTGYYPLYGLYAARNQEYLGKRKLNYIITSARSITQHSNVQDFMIEKFNFRRAYCKVQMEYMWWLRIIIDILYPLRKYMPGKIGTMLEMERISRMGGISASSK